MRDVNKYWKEKCCAPAFFDPADGCGFCDDTAGACAEKCSEAANAGLIVTGNGGVPGRSPVCGASGFWCRGCGRFWAQDTCGNHECEDHAAADGAKLTVVSGHVRCVCGKRLMEYVQPEMPYN